MPGYCPTSSSTRAATLGTRNRCLSSAESSGATGSQPPESSVRAAIMARPIGAALRVRRDFDIMRGGGKSCDAAPERETQPGDDFVHNARQKGVQSALSQFARQGTGMIDLPTLEPGHRVASHVSRQLTGQRNHPPRQGDNDAAAIEAGGRGRMRGSHDGGRE